MKTTRHSLMAKGIMVLLSLLVLIFAFSYSWFSPPQETVSASGITVSTQNPSIEFDVAVGFSNSSTKNEYLVSTYEPALNLTSLTVPGHSSTYDLMADFVPKDVTGDGNSLFIPVLKSDENDSNGKRIIDTESSHYSAVTPNKEYISFDLIFRSDSPCTVSLGEGSYVKALCETSVGDGSLVGSSATRKSSYGNFSQDAVVGAIRIAFVDYTIDNASTDGEVEGLNLENYTTDTSDFLNSTQILWLPRPDIYLQDVRNSVTGWSLVTDIPNTPDPSNSDQITFTPEGGSSTTVPNTYKHYYYKLVVDGTTHEEANYNNTLSDFDSDVSTQFARVSIPADTDEDGTADTYYGKARVNIWIEGCDAESRRAIAGGMFTVHLDLKTA